MSDPYAAIAAPADDPYAAVAAPAAPAKKRTLGDDVGGYFNHVLRGTGIGDELYAGAGVIKDVLTGQSGPNLVQTYKDELGKQRASEDSFSAAHPVLAANGRGLGNALTMIAPIGPGAEAFQGGGMALNALRGATLAAATGAGYAAVDRGSVQDRLKAAADATHDPLTLALGAVGGAVAGGKPKAKPGPAPTLDELTTQKNAAYRAVDESGLTIPHEDFKNLGVSMADAMDKEGFNAGLHPKAAAMIERIGKSERGASDISPTLTQLDQLRQQIGRDVASSNDPGERRMGTIMRGVIDDYISQLPGTEDLTRARDLNTRVSKLRSLDNLDEAAADRAGAAGVGANTGNALRQNVIRFQRDNPNLTPAEQEATQLAIRGGRGQNALRAIGSLSPEGGTVRAGASIVTGAASHGTIPAVGFIAKRVSDALVERNVQKLRDLIATGGEAAQEVSHQLADPVYADLRATLANDLAVQAGVQGTARHGGSVSVELPDHPELGVAFSRR